MRHDGAGDGSGFGRERASRTLGWKHKTFGDSSLPGAAASASIGETNHGFGGMNSMRSAIALLSLVLVAACGPKMEGSVLARTLTVRNTDTSTFKITRVIVNGDPNNGSCVDHRDATLQPGESTTYTFFTCGDIGSITVETNQGSAELR
jgi:hypothetical protein